MLNLPIDAHLREWAARPFAWGASDCVLFADAWVLRVTGRSAIPADAVWHDEASARALIERLGGWSSVARRVGLPRTADPLPGDVVLMRILTGAALGLMASRGPVFMATTGIVRVSSAPIVRAWRVDPA